MIDIAIICCCWVVSSLFAGIEAGLLSINPVRLRHYVKQQLPGAVRLNRLLKKPERVFVTVLLVTNMADILGLIVLTRRLVLMFGTLGFLVSLAIAFPVHLFLLAVLPASLFQRFPFRALVAMAGLLEFISFILGPFLALGDRLGRLVLPARREEERGRLFAAREELKQITAESEREGAISAGERTLIHNVVDFRGVKVRDVMLPLSKVVAVRPDTAVHEAIELSRSSGVDRLPVITNEGKPLGLVNALDLLLESDRQRPLTQQMRRMVFAGEDEPAYRAVRRLRASRLGLAGVVDREQKITGIVVIEDLIKRLVQNS